MTSSSKEPGSTSPRWIPVVFLMGLILIICICISAAVWVSDPYWLPELPNALSDETPQSVSQSTPVPTFTQTAIPLPATATLSPTSTSSPVPSATFTRVIVPTDTVIPSPTRTEATVTPTPSYTPVPLPTATPIAPEFDFVVTQQRMRTNEENSWDGTLGNCGADHTIYLLVIDAAGNPLNSIIVGDTYNNVRASSGSAGPGRMAIKLWSNTMSMQVKGHVDGTEYSSHQTVPLSTKDEDIPVEWLFEGGYCPSISECQLRQQTNGLCRGHYSYDITFQRSW